MALTADFLRLGGEGGKNCNRCLGRFQLYILLDFSTEKFRNRLKVAGGPAQWGNWPPKLAKTSHFDILEIALNHNAQMEKCPEPRKNKDLLV